MAQLIDLSTKSFGMWLVKSRASNDRRGCARWLCQCACGTERVVSGDALRSGRSTGCGCSNIIDPERDAKKCSHCQVIKPIQEFGRRRAAKDGRAHYCRYCTNLTTKWRRRRRYGLTDEEYWRLAVAQDRRCGACREAVELVIDHDHATGNVRGLLCNPCNKALGFLRDDLTRIKGLLDYLSNHQDGLS